ncbi:MAG: hypothetical protein AAFQ57_17510, partial [Cyanobacteria bacterium J06626_14]
NKPILKTTVTHPGFVDSPVIAPPRPTDMYRQEHRCDTYTSARPNDLIASPDRSSIYLYQA